MESECRKWEMKMNGNGVLVYLEAGHSGIQKVSLELLSAARELTKKNGGKVTGICILKRGEEESRIAELKEYSLQELYLYTTEEEYQADIYEEAMADCIHSISPAVLLIGGTVQGRAIAPRIAVEFQTGVTADCTSLEIGENGLLISTRPAFGGNIMASILTPDTRPQIATVREGMFPLPVEEGFRECLEENKIVRKMLVSEKRKIIVLERHIKMQTSDIAKQKLLIAAGRGIKRKEDLEMLKKLAERLGGLLVSSRALVEKGWMKQQQQIGLSGMTAAPDCMITFGISGSVQFQAGMKYTKNIIAVNNDKDAPIFEIAHIPICADLNKVIPKLMEFYR